MEKCELKCSKYKFNLDEPKTKKFGNNIVDNLKFPFESGQNEIFEKFKHSKMQAVYKQKHYKLMNFS